MPSLDAPTALPGPDWLQARRTVSAEHLAAAARPTTDEEVWRYSRIAELDLDAVRPVDTPAAANAVAAARAHADAVVPDRSGLVVVVDGFVGAVDLEPDAVTAGVVAGRAGELPSGQEVLGSVVGTPTDYFGALHDAGAPEPVVVDVPRGAHLARPLVVVHRTETDGGLTLPRLAVRAGDNSEVAVVDLQVSADVAAVSVPVVELDVGPSARLGYVAVQELGRRVWQLGTQASRVGAQAHLRAATAAFGGDYTRLRSDCALAGRGATGDLLAAYFGDDDQTLDFRTFQDHVAPDTTSNLLFKGAVAGRSRSVYTGLIRVRPEARGTNAFQTNRNLKLSEHAWAESVPNLEIENNDVRCSHASTVGPVDEQQRFYLESRGVPTAAAERLIVAGFFDEVIGQLPVAAVAAEVRRQIAAELDGQAR